MYEAGMSTIYILIYSTIVHGIYLKFIMSSNGSGSGSSGGHYSVTYTKSRLLICFVCPY